jgi:charged multivesicular body protein 4
LQDDLEAELEELEGAELEEQLLQPATIPHTKLPAVQNYSPPAQAPARRAPPQSTTEDDELAALQAEMAL